MSEVLHSLNHADARAGTAARAVGRSVRVLHVFRYFRPDFTGDGLYFEKLFPRLAREGVENQVAVAVTRPAPGVPPTEGVRLFGRGGNSYFNLSLLLWFAANAWRFDVVHLHSAVDRAFAYHIIARLSGCRIVQSCTLDDSLGSVVRGYSPPYRWLVRRLCGLIDDVVAISPRLLADTLAAAPKGRVHFIPQGVAIPHLDVPQPGSSLRETLGVGADDTLLLFVGGICPRKDARFLVENHPAELGGLHLVLVGPSLDDTYFAGLRAAIAGSHAASRIHLTGYMEDPAPAYRAADAFVFASHSEGCPNVLLEAMAHGLPAVARHLPGTTDTVVEHGRTGILFETAEEYDAAVRRLAADPAERQAMGAAAHASICSTYEMDAIAARYAALYRQS